MMVDVARLVPSAGATLGRVAPIVKSGTIIDLNVRGSVRCDSDVCGVHTAKLSTNTASSVLLNRRQVGESRDGSDISRPGCDDKMGVCAFFSVGNVGFAKRNIMFVRQINGTQFDLQIERRSL